MTFNLSSDDFAQCSRLHQRTEQIEAICCLVGSEYSDLINAH